MGAEQASRLRRRPGGHAERRAVDPGMTCAACAARIEKKLNAVGPEVIAAAANGWSAYAMSHLDRRSTVSALQELAHAWAAASASR
jgi:hypothetical protein